MSSGIYKIVNKENGKIYIGQSTNLAQRKRNHFSRLDRQVHSNIYLQNVYNKYGRDILEFKIIEKCEPELLDEKEEEYIQKYDTLNPDKGYNLVNGGCDNRYFSDVVRAKMSEALSGRIFTEEHKRKISESNKGREISQKAIDKQLKTKKENRIFYGEDNPNSDIKDKEAKEIIIKLLNGLSVNELKKEYNCSKYTVYNLIQNRTYKCVLPNKRNELKNLFGNKQKSKEEKAVKLYKKGLSQNKISKRLNISRNTIRRLLKERNINTRRHINQYVNTEVN